MNVQTHQTMGTHNEEALNVLVRAITLSEGTFSLVLVRCNYPELGEQVYQSLNEEYPNIVNCITLSSSSTTLYTAIKNKLGDKPSSALMVVGLESVAAIDDLLAATNQVRDAFRKHFTFPLVLWCNDNILGKFRKFAPDFYSWATVPIKFGLDTEALVQRLKKVTDELFSEAMDIGAGRFPHSSALYLSPTFCPQQELKATLTDLQARGHSLEPILDASLQFIWGLNAYAKDHVKQAKEQYLKSLRLLAQHNFPASYPDYQLRIERLSCVLFYSGIWWRRYAILNRKQYTQACKNARKYYRQSIRILQKNHRPEITTKFIIALGEVLQRLKAWEELAKVAETAVKLHTKYFDPIRLAYSYGLLAEVALAKKNWHLGKEYAEKAIQVNSQKPLPTRQAQSQHQELQWAEPHYQSLYLLLLADAQWHLEQRQAAIENLEKAHRHCKPDYDPLLYTRILERLQKRYFQQGDYLKAFRTKQQQRSIGQQYRLQAFVGAGRLRPEYQVVTPALSPRGDLESIGLHKTSRKNLAKVAQEISDSGRQHDLDNLIRRIKDKQHKLTILHGQSGVGKSSIINAGLVPALAKTPIEARNVIPVVLSTYSDWCRELGSCLTVTSHNPAYQVPPCNAEQILKPHHLLNQLAKNEHHSLMTVLIFDQFEEFFFNCAKFEQRKEFFEFLKRCLDLAYVNVILVLREDYLHYLLACDNFEIEAINNDILGRHNRYSLGNLSVKNTKLLIQRLTRDSQFTMENALVDRLTIDLAQECDEVRPIELQVVGMQLQEENISTLKQYQKLGKNPKEILIGRFLEQVIRDCGPENEEVTNLVLFLLTDEKGTRPMKTKDELRSNLSKLLPDHSKCYEQLDLILQILEESGLVLVLLFRETPVLQEVPPPRFQLVHDYLVELIRQRQKPALLEELEKLRKKNEFLEVQAREDKLKGELAIQQEQRKHAEDQLQRAQKQRQQIKKFSSVIGLLAITAIGLAVTAWIQARQAKFSQLQAMASESIALSSSGKELEALLVNIKAGNRMLKQSRLGVQDTVKIVAQFSNVVHNIKEFNRLQRGHSSWVNEVSFSPDGSLIASGSADSTIKLWKSTGKLLATDLKHKSRVNSARFSPDGQILATASADRSIKLWDMVSHKLLQTLTAHGGSVNSLSFSPDGKMLASASDDHTVIIWDLNNYHNPTKRLTLKHNNQVKSVSFNPNPARKSIVTASWDKTVNLWDYNGVSLGTLVDRDLSSDEIPISHADKVSIASFSPDGNFIASGGLDNKIKLWNHDGTLIQVLGDHKDRVTSLAFNHNSEILVSASADKTLRTWQLDTERRSFEGGNVIENIDAINVQFQKNSQDNTFAVAGANNDVRLFRLEGMEPPTLRGHNELVNSLDFNPIGTTLVSGGDINFGKEGAKQTSPHPGELILWDLNGHKLETWLSLGRVLSLSFSPDGEKIASVEESINQSNAPVDQFEQRDFLSAVDRKVILRDLEGKLLSELILQERNKTDKVDIKSISFSPAGQYIAIAQDLLVSNKGRVTLWHPKQEQELTFETGSSAITDISFHPHNEKMLATAHENGVFITWDIAGNLIRKFVAHDKKITSLRFSPDGQLIASGSQDNTVKIWDVASGEELRKLKGHIATITSIDFQKEDDKVLAAASVDGAIRLWSIESEELLATFQSGKDSVNSIKFSPDGQTIAAATDNAVILWNLDLDNYLLERSCAWLTDYLNNNPNVKEEERQLCL